MVITPEGCIEGEVKNISPTGAFIHCFTEPEQQNSLRLVFRDPLRKKLLLITAELAWSNIENYVKVSNGIVFCNMKNNLWIYFLWLKNQFSFFCTF